MIVQARFEPVRAAFEASVRDGVELGARFTVVEREAVVLDLWGGFADTERTRPFDEATLTPVFSVTKILASLMVARLVDQGAVGYERPVSEVWPEFASAGKGGVTLETLMSHQAGLSGFMTPMDPEDWFDWTLTCDRLAAMKPIWPPGTASGYHPVTLGYLAGEVFRRVDGRSLGGALAQDVAGPLGLDLFIGLPPSEDARVAVLERPRALPAFGRPTEALRAAFQTKWAAPPGRGSTAWRRAEIPSANGYATAEALAKLMGWLAEGGGPVLSGKGVDALARRRIVGQDLVLPFTIPWGAGVMGNEGLNVFGPGASTFGHYGWGGACALADPERGLGAAYVMNKQSAHLIGDPRARRLIDLVYACL